MSKMYLREEFRNTNEKKTGYASYSTLVRDFIGDTILCNKIMEVDECLFDNIIVGELAEDDDVFQAYICNVADWNIDQLKELHSDSIILAYSELLETEVLLVTHWGTSWDYVETDVELVNDDF